jgi:hypothetical protein
MALFDKWDEEMLEHARTTGAAQEAIMGDQPPANTPFKSVEYQAMESHSLHKYRIGKYAKFIEEMYKDWFIPYMVKQITKGIKFLSELDLDDMQKVADEAVKNKAKKLLKKRVLSSQVVFPDELKLYKDVIREEFMKDNKKFLEILKEEFKSLPIKVKVNVSSKQKDLASWTDKLVGVFRQIIGSVNPQTGQSMLDDPRVAKLFNDILVSAGLSPIDFSPPAEQAIPAEQVAVPAQAGQA